MVGASWWPIPPSFEEQRGHLGKDQYNCVTLEECFKPGFKNRFLIAWPEGDLTIYYVSIKQALVVGGNLLDGYRNAMDMEGRCGIIGRLGGKRCYCKGEYPETDYLDWSFRDPGKFGCASAPLIVDLDALDAIFDLVQRRDVVRWASNYCKRNGWKKW
ncbi:hypothetical protein Ptr902_12687 [Pyrenophora tritici-repentis]|nr:hypothetical protein Ptr902_12687 [Pyrenophora tritici-repentis]